MGDSAMERMKWDGVVDNAVDVVAEQMAVKWGGEWQTALWMLSELDWVRLRSSGRRGKCK